MSTKPSISAAEWEVMIVLWNQAPMMASEVVQRLANHKEWKGRTIKTLLNRLVKKGAVGFVARGKTYLYRPLVSRDACVLKESRTFASRVFGGAVGPMLVQFVRQAHLTDCEIEELKQTLNEKLSQLEKRP
jgi:BlaI family penicillinase repressor